MSFKKAAVFSLKLAVSAVTLAIIFSRTDTSHVFSVVKGVGVFYFGVASLIYMASLYVSSMRWKLLLLDEFPLGKLFRLNLIGSFFGNFLPGAVGGDFVKAYYLNKDAKKMSLTLASVFIDRYLGYVSLMIIGMISFPFALGFISGSPVRWLMPGIFLAFIVGSFLFFTLQVGRRFSAVAEFYGYFVSLWARRDVIFKAIAYSAVVQCMGFFSVSMLASAMGQDIPILVLFAFLPIVITLTTIPVSISGLGIREGAFVILLGFIGVRPEIATSLSLSWFISIFFGSLPGLVEYIRHSDKPPRV